ncbi:MULTISPECIES: DUF3619 family protein [Burkholderiaceae]|uniref:DUF3619 family protein n=1 Tax=Burkholderiaceae TaxID=119060 RepID=UPI00096241A7|nr:MULTISPECIES: DUF3619 family protein [Burkholderiaceae]MCG1039891.1 DUF3619 family protein [Mycetohabitans sp. B7]SIT71503.1 Protein of unknown function [Burkholderia sp. b14]
MSGTLETKEIEFALKVRRALDEGAARLPRATTDRLAAARQAALARKRPDTRTRPVYLPALAGAGNVPTGTSGARKRARWSRLALVWPLLALVCGLAAIRDWENQQRLADIAAIDAAMLSDELPLSAYLDHGFHAYLSHGH